MLFRSFAKSGAKIGSSLRVRKPDEFTVSTTSRVMDLQEQAEGYETITLASLSGPHKVLCQVLTLHEEKRAWRVVSHPQ